MRKKPRSCIICVESDKSPPIPPSDQEDHVIAYDFSDLEPFLPDLATVVSESLATFVSEYGPVRHLQNQTTSASAIHDIMERKAEELMVQDPHRFQTRSINNLFLLLVLDRYAIRLKLLDEGLQPKNNPTVQSAAFQMQQLSLPDVDGEVVSLNLGYVPD